MGNLGMVHAQNPLGMFGQQVLVPSFNAPFGQVRIAVRIFGCGFRGCWLMGKYIFVHYERRGRVAPACSSF